MVLQVQQIFLHVVKVKLNLFLSLLDFEHPRSKALPDMQFIIQF